MTFALKTLTYCKDLLASLKKKYQLRRAIIKLNALPRKMSSRLSKKLKKFILILYTLRAKI